MLWEVGDGQCFINASLTSPCDAGLVPRYSVNATSTEDIQKAVNFASQHDLYLVIKNTGHDHLGRSSGAGAFAIWTHNLKGREWHNDFVAHGAPWGTEGQHAVTLQAGEQWLDVYRDAARHKRIVVGGAARTVGAAGGYFTGGGHSPFAADYGLAVDNVLEVKIVDANGELLPLSEYRYPDHFWAVRGGGGCAWGVIVEVTYKTYPEPEHLQLGFVQMNSTTPEAFGELVRGVLRSLVDVTDAGYTGYGFVETNKSFSGIFIKPNGTAEMFEKGFARFRKLTGSQDSGLVGQLGNFNLPRWIDYCDTFLTDPNIAMNVQDASRLLTKEVALEKADEVLDLITDFLEYEMGFNFSENLSFLSIVSADTYQSVSHTSPNAGRPLYILHGERLERL